MSNIQLNVTRKLLTDAAVLLLVKYSVASFDVLLFTFLKRLALTIIDHDTIRRMTLEQTHDIRPVSASTTKHKTNMRYLHYLTANSKKSDG